MPLESQKAWHIEREYGSLDYKDKVVLDIGADYGCTPEFFLSRGARKVIAVEDDIGYYDRLSSWATEQGKLSDGTYRVVTIPGMKSGEALELMQWKPQIVKIDCEGCECEFLRLNDDVLRLPEAYIMETHSVALFEAFTQTFRRLRYAVTMIEEFPRNPVTSHRKVFKAERRQPPRRRTGRIRQRP